MSLGCTTKTTAGPAFPGCSLDHPGSKSQTLSLTSSRFRSGNLVSQTHLPSLLDIFSVVILASRWVQGGTSWGIINLGTASFKLDMGSVLKTSLYGLVKLPQLTCTWNTMITVSRCWAHVRGFLVLPWIGPGSGIYCGVCLVFWRDDNMLYWHSGWSCACCGALASMLGGLEVEGHQLMLQASNWQTAGGNIIM